MNNKITFHQLAENVSRLTSVSSESAEAFIKGFFDTLAEALEKGETVRIKGLGTFTPIKGEEECVDFIPDRDLADTVNAPFAPFQVEEINDGVTDDMLDGLNPAPSNVEKAIASAAVTEEIEEAEAETAQQLKCYADFFENVLAIPVVPGRKTEKEKFAGAEATYTVECMMKDRKALQGATSHYFGDKFSRAYDVTFTGRDNKLQYPFQTSWGSTTRMIGAVIMTHGDNNGLVLPPRIAPTQVVIVPIAAHKNPEVLETAKSVMADLIAADVRVKLDDSDQSMGWKCAEYEMRGVPIRLELGPRDLAEGNCCLVRRDNGEKVTAKIEGIVDEIKALLDAIHDNMYTVAEKNLEDNTFDLKTIDEVKEMASGRGGFARTKWCGSLECELKMKEVAGVSSRCMPLKQSGTTGKCVCCGKECTTDIYWGVAY